jgi:hypothetical protein
VREAKDARVVEGADLLTEVSRPREGPLEYERKEVGGGAREVVVQLAGVEFPPVCCACLERTEFLEVFRYWENVEVPLPLCETCALRWRRRKRVVRAAYVGVMVTAALAMLVWNWPGSQPGWGRFWAGLLIAGPSMAGSVWFLVARRVGPARLSGFDRERNTIRIRFANGRYAEMFERFRKGRERDGEGELAK